MRCNEVNHQCNYHELRFLLNKKRYKLNSLRSSDAIYLW